MNTKPGFECTFCLWSFLADELRIIENELMCSYCYVERRPCPDDDDQYPPPWDVDWDDQPEFVPEHVREIHEIADELDKWRTCACLFHDGYVGKNAAGLINTDLMHQAEVLYDALKGEEG